MKWLDINLFYHWEKEVKRKKIKEALLTTRTSTPGISSAALFPWLDGSLITHSIIIQGAEICSNTRRTSEQRETISVCCGGKM